MGVLQRMFSGGSEIQLYNPLDVLFTVNPEIGALAYAHKERVLTPELMPLLANFRQMQRDERITFLREMTQRMGIEAHEREISKIVDGDVHKTKLVEQGLTTRSSIEANAAIDIQRLKYSSHAKMVNDYVQGQRYISDNECKARMLEAKSIADTLQMVARIRRGEVETTSKHRLEQAVTIAALETRSALEQAEILRKRDTELAYIHQQTALALSSIHLGAEKARAQGIIGVECYKTIAEALISGTSGLVQSGLRNYQAIIHNSKFGDTEIRIRMY